MSDRDSEAYEVGGVVVETPLAEVVGAGDVGACRSGRSRTKRKEPPAVFIADSGDIIHREKVPKRQEPEMLVLALPAPKCAHVMTTSIGSNRFVSKRRCVHCGKGGDPSGKQQVFNELTWQ